MKHTASQDEHKQVAGHQAAPSHPGSAKGTMPAPKASFVSVIIGGIITLMVGISVKCVEIYLSNQQKSKELKTQLLIKASEAKNLDEFKRMISNYKDLGLLDTKDELHLDSIQYRFFLDWQQQLSYANDPDTGRIGPINVTSTLAPSTKNTSMPPPSNSFYYTIVAGGDNTLEGAEYEVTRAKKIFPDTIPIHIYWRANAYRTCIGHYTSYNAANVDLYTVADKVNSTAYIQRLDKWCASPTLSDDQKYFICK